MTDLFDYAAGKSAKENGQAQVECHNENFVEIMREVAVKLCAKNGQVTCDDLRAYALANHIKPKHPNAWGAIFRGEHWKQTGWTKSKLVTNHARANRIWTVYE